MAKSSLVRSLLWAHRQIHGARLTGMPVKEFAQQGAEIRRNRRDFLKNCAGAAVVTAGMAAMPKKAFADNPHQSPLPSVAIIGAGLAGLHCAWQLKYMGAQATIYESSPRVTGRIFTDRTTFASDNMFSDLGGEYIDTDHTYMHSLAQRFGLSLLDYHEDEPLIDTYFDFGGVRRTTQQVLDAYAPIAEHIDDANHSVNNFYKTIMFNQPNGGEALDAHSISSFLTSIGASGWIKNLIEIAYETEFGLDTNDNNLINMLYMISTDVKKMKRYDRMDLYGISDERFHCATGNDSIPRALADELPGQIELGKKLTALRMRSDGKYVMTFNGSQEITADHVVLALPFTILRTIDLSGLNLPAWKTNAINNMGYGQITKVISGHTSPVWRQLGYIGNSYSDRGFQSTTETNRMQPGSAGILENYLAGTIALNAANGTPAEQVGIFHNQVENIFPGVKASYNGKHVRMAWSENPHSKAAYSSYRVGQYTTIAGAEPIRIGNLHFCGEHTTIDYQGWMEGAARSGADAASEVGADLKLSPPKARINGRKGTTIHANG